MSEERHALVTGASRGIGRAVALKLAENGYSVSFCYRSESAAADQTAKELAERGVAYYHAPCDVSDGAAVESFIATAEAQLGKVHTLVNSAGITRDNPMVLMPAADWHAVIDTNLTGTFNFCRAMSFGFMKRQEGTIVNISSVAGVYGNRAQTNYAAAKAGIHGMSKSLAKELAPYGIRVNVVAPGFIETDMTGELSDKARKAASKMIGLGRFGQVEDVSGVVAFLASDAASYITGQVIQVDGGIVI
jgi:3-oxoacyl-[acyl-carrier protein] reductase